MPDARISVTEARNSLVAIWTVGGAIPFLLLAVQTLLGKYDAVQDIWAWFLPLVLPTIALMFGVLRGTALQGNTDNRTVDAFYLALSKRMSCFYIGVLLLVFLCEPFSKLSGLKLYLLSNYFLGPLSSVVVGVVTVLFTSQDAGGRQEDDARSVGGSN